MNVNKKLLPIKAHYFLKNAASAAVVPFLPIIAKNLNFPSSYFRLIMTSVPVLSLVTKPLAGVLADKLGAHKLFYLFFLIVNMGFAMMVNHLPPLSSDQTVVMKCYESTDIVVSTNRGNDRCYMRRLRALMDNLPMPCQVMRTDRSIGSRPRAYQGNNRSSVHNLPKQWSIIPIRKCHSHDDFWNVWADQVLPEQQMFCNEAQDLINVMNDHKRDWDIQNTTSGFKVGISFPLAKENGNIHMKLDYINTSRQSWLEPSCPDPNEWDCQLACKNPMVHDLVTNLSESESTVTAQPQFWLIAATFILLKLSSRNLATMGDTICFKLLGDKPNNAGYQMMWSGIGWGLVTIGTSYMVDLLSDGEPMKDFTYAVYISGIFFVLNLLVGISFDFKKNRTPGVIREKMYHSFVNPSSSIFLAWVIVCGIFSALTWNFLFRYIIDIAKEEGCSDVTWVKTLDWFTLGVQCFVGEVPFFYLSNWMLNHLGHTSCMSLVLFGFSLRFLLYYFLTSPWWILPIEIFNGLTYATFQATMLTYANAIALEGTSATVQGVVSGVFEGVGVTAGVIVGNQLINIWGVRKLFLVASISSAVLGILHISLMVMKTLTNSSCLNKYDRKLPPEQFEVTDQEDESR